MASRIITKKGSGAPLASDLVHGELAVDTVNKRLYTEDAGGTVIEVGTNPTSITTGNFGASGTIDLTGATVSNAGSITTADINGGTIDGTAIGGTVATFGNFTTGQFYTSLNVDGPITADGLTVDGEASVITLNNTDTSLSIGQTLAKIDVKQNDPSDQGVGTVASIEVENKGSIQGLGQFNFKTGSATSLLNRASIAENGDISFYEDTGTTAKFFWDASAESLGIGTSAPDSVLHVFGNTASNVPRIKIEASGWSNDCRIERSSGSDGFYVTNNYDTSASSADNTGAGTSGLQLARGFAAIHTGALGAFDEAMRIDSSGRLLLNRTVSTGSLTLESQAPSGFSVGSGFYTDVGQSTIEFKDSNTTANYKVRIGSETDDMVMFAGGTERARIDSSGHLQLSGSTDNIIRSGSDSSRVRIFGGGTDSVFNGSALTLQGATHSGGNYADLASGAGGYINFRIGTSNAARLDSSGNLLVGTAVTDRTASTGITLASTGFIDISRSGTIAGRFTRIGTDGSVIDFRKESATVGSISVTASATTYNTSSDERLKENITDAPAGNVDDIKVRSFDWKVDGSHQDYGMVAQELEAVAPYAVTKGQTEDDMWSVDYSKLVPMLIKEIQDLKAEVAALKGAN